MRGNSSVLCQIYPLAWMHSDAGFDDVRQSMVELSDDHCSADGRIDGSGGNCTIETCKRLMPERPAYQSTNSHGAFQELLRGAYWWLK